MTLLVSITCAPCCWGVDGYGGNIIIEQERDPRNSDGVLADLAASRDFLRRTGF